MANKVIPEKITLARQLRGFSQGDLAEKMSPFPGAIKQATISRIELGLQAPSSEVFARLVEALGFPEPFFTEPGGSIAPGMKYHRARKSVPRKLLDRQDAMISIMRHHIEKLFRSVEIANDNIRCIDPDQYSSPEETARAVREFWKVPRGPIKDLTALIELAGGVVVHCDFATDKLDGLSVSVDKLPPLIFINKNATGDRMRYSTAHELGHAIQHAFRPPLGDEEEESNRFAAEFLMPESEIRPHLSNLDVGQLARLKRYWGVSMASLLYRANTLGCISDRKLKSLRIELAPFRKREPAELDIPRERPALLGEVINIHLEQLGFDIQELAVFLAMNVDELMEWYGLRRTSQQFELLTTRTQQGGLGWIKGNKGK
ncbi:MAG TPA: XRE family transcriptional regulator [Candidatus Paceibacterota bacterium]|nr:XRE family transcriptional regulator [Candidatus Paceibacterota bacterium]